LVHGWLNKVQQKLPLFSGISPIMFTFRFIMPLLWQAGIATGGTGIASGVTGLPAGRSNLNASLNDFLKLTEFAR